VTARTLVVATTNRGKAAEFARLLSGLSARVVALSDIVADSPRVVEDGSTLAENAALKARAAARATGMLALADDSGLEVDALDGRPGVRSARFAGERATDQENYAELLAQLARSAKPAPFGARFRCALALVDPAAAGDGERLWTVEGVCEGTIGSEPRGAFGFGYDPVFVVAGRAETMAELDPEEKNRLSHRARAVSALRPLLESLLAAQ